MAMGDLKAMASGCWLALLLMCVGVPAGFGHAQILDSAAKDISNASDEKEQDPIFGSPRDALQSFLKASSSTDEDSTLATAILPVDDISQNPAVQERLTNSIYAILEYLGWTPDAANTHAPGTDFKGDSWQVFPFKDKLVEPLSARSNDLERASGGRYQLVLQRDQGGGFRFSSESVKPSAIDALKSAVETLRRKSGTKTYTSLSDWMSINAPASLLEQHFFLKLWQWLALVVVLFLGFLIDFIVRMILWLVVSRILKHFNADPDQKRIKQSIRAFGLFTAAITWYLLLNLLGLPIAAYTIIQPVSKVVFVLAITWCLWRVTDLIGDIFTSRAGRTDTKLDDILVPMARKSVKGVILVFALLNIAPLFGLEIGPLLAAVGVGTVALGFAFKNTIENFFGSVTVVLDRPFQVGDWVVCDKIEGTVEAVGMRSTRIRTFYNSLVTMPNSLLITNEVDNYGLRKYRRWSSTLGLSMQTPPDLVDAFCEALREIIRQHPYTRKDYYQVWLNEFGNSTYDVMIYVFWEAPDWQTELRERHRFMLEILRVAEAMDVSFAYPTQTVYVERAPKAGEPGIKDMDAKSPAQLRQEARNIVRSITKDDDWQQEIPPKYRFFSAQETSEIDRHTDEERMKQMEDDLHKREQQNLPPEAGDDPEQADFTEQRDAGG